ncbi:MAG: amidohydrolase [Bacillota bacterium]|nr:amidohydrolase [Bacillota bacterium]
MLAITGGKVLTITQGTLEGGTVLIDGGKIVAVGQNVAVPADAEVIDARGKWVTPGLIDAHSHLAVFGEPSIPATADGNERTDPNTAQVRGRDALNPQDPAIPKVVAGGVTTVFTGPGSANIIGGTGMVIKLRGRTVDEMIIPGTEGLKMALGENPKRNYGEQRKMPATRMGNAAVLREALVAAQTYLEKIDRANAEAAKDGKPAKLPDRNLKLETIGRALKREIKARIHAHRADDILTAISIAEEFGLDYVIEHCTYGYKIPDILAAKKVQATIGPLLMGPGKHEIWETTLENPGILARAGVKVAIQADTSSATKWLPLQVGLAIRHGMEEDEAFRAVTINPAEIIGVADRLGSLEAGKDADVVVWNGHPFCNFTRAETVLIDGVKVFELCSCDCCRSSCCCDKE